MDNYEKEIKWHIKIEDANNPGKALRTIKFSGAYICSFQESLVVCGGGTSISIACTAIDINNIKYDVSKGK